MFITRVIKFELTNPKLVKYLFPPSLIQNHFNKSFQSSILSCHRNNALIRNQEDIQ